MASISFIKAKDSEGFVYDQRITIDKNTFLKLKGSILAEMATGFPRKQEYSYGNIGHSLLQHSQLINGRFYMNHTTTRFINLFLKLKLKSRNTYVVVA